MGPKPWFWGQNRTKHIFGITAHNRGRFYQKRKTLFFLLLKLPKLGPKSHCGRGSGN